MRTVAESTRIRSILWRCAANTLRLGRSRDTQLIAWLALAIGSGFIAYIARLHEVTHDAFHEMSLFREALLTDEFPTRDLFAYTPTVQPSVHHEWATGAVLYFATIGTGMGALGLTVLRFLLVAALWLLLYRVARMRGAHPYIFFLMSLVVFPVLWVGFATLRAQLFTLVFIAAQLWMQELDWRGRRAWCVLWLIMLVAWLNLHAGFVVGIGLIALHGVERFVAAGCQQRSVRGAFRATWHLGLTAPIAVLALRLNPYGWDYLPYLVRAIAMPRPLIVEWRPLWHTHLPAMTVAFFAISVGLFAYAQRNTRYSRSHGAAFLALSTYMAIKHIRHGSIYGVVWIAYVPAWISHTPLGKHLIQSIDSHRALAIRGSQACVCASLVFAAYHQCWLPTMPGQPVYSRFCYPIGAVEYLKQHSFQGNLLTPFYAGSYVSWEMHPKVKVSLDGRYEVAFQPEVMEEHQQFFEASDAWWSCLEKYPTDAVLIPTHAPVCSQLSLLGPRPQDLERLGLRQRWRVVYRDDSFVVLAADHCMLPKVDGTNQRLPDGARQAFGRQHAHWNLQPRGLAWLPENSRRLSSQKLFNSP